MQFFLFFLVSCIALGMLTAKQSVSRLTLMVAAVSFVALLGYFFLDLI